MSVSKAQWKDQAVAGETIPLFKFVVKTSDGTINVAGNGERAYGVSYAYEKDGRTGDIVTVDTSGILKVEAGSTVATGAIVASDADGNCVPAAAGDYPLGVARKGGADGVIIEIDFETSNIAVAS